MALLLVSKTPPALIEISRVRQMTVGAADSCDIVAHAAQPGRRTPAVSISLLPIALGNDGVLELRLAHSAVVSVNGIRVVGRGPVIVNVSDMVTFGPPNHPDAVVCRVVQLDAAEHPDAAIVQCSPARLPTDLPARALRASPLRRGMGSYAASPSRDAVSPFRAGVMVTPPRRSPLRVLHPPRFADPCANGCSPPSPLKLPPTRHMELLASIPVPPAPHASMKCDLPPTSTSIPLPYRVSPLYLCCGPDHANALLPTAAQGEHAHITGAQLMTARGLKDCFPHPTLDTTCTQKAQGIVETLMDRFGPQGQFDSPEAHVAFLIKEFRGVFGAAAAIFDAEPPVLHLNAPCWCCGDLHGSFEDLVYIMHEVIPFGNVTYQSCPFVFLGDYVDRGDHSVEVVMLLMAWKVRHPTQVWLLRGNHEDPQVNGDVEQYGDTSFRQRCCDLLGEPEGTAFWEAANRVFASLPVAAVVDHSVFLCHGGVPHMSLVARTLTGYDTRADLRLEDMVDKLSNVCETPNVERRVCAAKHFTSLMPVADDADTVAAFRQLLRELVWNDPCSIATSHGPTHAEVQAHSKRMALDEHGFRCNIGRGDDEGIIHEFSYDAVEAFLAANGWSLLIRAHQHKAHGIEVGSHAKVVTLFSSCNYANENAAGACFLADGMAHLVSWRRASMSPPRGLHPAGDTAVPTCWSCGLLPSSAHFSLQYKTGATTNVEQSERRGPTVRLDLATNENDQRKSPTPRCSPASDGTPRPSSAQRAKRAVCG